MKKLKQNLLSVSRSCLRFFRTARVFHLFGHDPRRIGYKAKGGFFANSWKPSLASVPARNADAPNELERYFDAHREGLGIWKYQHYFPIYERHFRKFVGKEVHVLEIGIYSGGSLEMWREYFGHGSVIYGVDIEESCSAYENSYTHIAMGDQADPRFWAGFCDRYPRIDIVIDDGGHRFEQQRTTFEAMLPHLQPGGVYLCEDLAGVNNRFIAYLQGFTACLNRFDWNVADEVSADPTELQKELSSVHFYPYVAVVEKRETPLQKICAPKRGTQWQPFFDR